MSRKKNRPLKPLLIGTRRCRTCNFFAPKDSDQCSNCVARGIVDPLPNKKAEPTPSRDAQLFNELDIEYSSIIGEC